VFTFGHGQRLRSTGSHGELGDGQLGIGWRLHNRYVRIVGTEAETRATMRAIFGEVWSMEYDAADPKTDAMIAQWGMRELDISEPLAELARDAELARIETQVRAEAQRARTADLTPPQVTPVDLVPRCQEGRGPGRCILPEGHPVTDRGHPCDGRPADAPGDDLAYVNVGDDTVNGSWAT
jgi:hypothetical protein